jgi:hypothetical protein
MKLKIKNRKDFITNILNPISNLSDSTIIKIEKNKISNITASQDATLVLYSETECDSDGEKNLNIPDIKKLVRVVECIDVDELQFDINSNNLQYSSDSFKFKYHLLEDGLMKLPSINIKKINELKFDTIFKVPEQKLTALFKGASFTTETNKLYIYFENNKIYAELGDKNRQNSDNFQTVIADTYTGAALNKNIPINFDTFRLINFSKSSDIEFYININYGVLKISLTKGNTKLIYIVSALIN